MSYFSKIFIFLRFSYFIFFDWSKSSITVNYRGTGVGTVGAIHPSKLRFIAPQTGAYPYLEMWGGQHRIVKIPSVARKKIFLVPPWFFISRGDKPPQKGYHPGVIFHFWCHWWCHWLDLTLLFHYESWLCDKKAVLSLYCLYTLYSTVYACLYSKYCADTAFWHLYISKLGPL